MPLSDVLAALRWWGAVTALGFLAAPVTFRLLGRLPDRGYAFTKLVGLLGVSYLFWLLASLGVLRNDFGGILLSLLIVAIVSLWAAIDLGKRSSGKRAVLIWLRRHWRYVLVAELIFASMFALWVWARSQNPAIVATEKPMEFAFLNSATSSPSYPPLDPWLSGFAISYYYFGYVMTSLLVRLAGVSTQVGFNLGIAWLAAATSLTAFGLLYNLIAPRRQQLSRVAVLFGLLASVAIPVAGNSEIILELLHARGIGSAEFWSWLDVRDLDGVPVAAREPRYESSGWWWWRSSRVIHEYHLSGRAEEGLEPIAEFPAFSFVLGDLHPHVLALPFAFLSLAVALSWWKQPPLSSTALFSQLRERRIVESIRAVPTNEWTITLFTALLLGALSFLNTWDVLIHLFVVLGSYALARRRLEGTWSRAILWQVAVVGLVLVLPAIFLYLPFYIGFRSQAGPPFLLPMTMRPTRLAHFLIIFALPFSAIIFFLARLIVSRETWRDRALAVRDWRNALWLAAGLVIVLFGLLLLLALIVAASSEGQPRVADLANELGLALSPAPGKASLADSLPWAAGAIWQLLPIFVGARIQYPWLTVILSLVIGAVWLVLATRLRNRAYVTSTGPAEQVAALRPSDSSGADTPDAVAPTSEKSIPFVLLLIGTGALLAIGPEFLFLRDNFGQRINTIFKFYYQAWGMLGVAGVFALYYLLNRFRASGIVALATYGTLLIGGLLFPWHAVSSRSIEYRGPVGGENRLQPTLDGLAHLDVFNPDELEAIRWLRRYPQRPTYIAEAVGGQYSAYGRVSASTGLPTILGWAGHEYQWRGATPEPAARESAVELIYSAVSDWDATAGLLTEYGVELVYYGDLERTSYDPRVAEKFNQNMEVAFRNSSVTIYRWRQDDRRS